MLRSAIRWVAAMSLVASAAAQTGFDPLEVALSRASSALAEGRWSAALEAAEEALSYSPSEARAVLIAARAEFGSGAHRAALARVNAVPPARRGYGLWFEQARAARAVGDLSQAETGLDAALALYPASGPARSLRIDILFELGHLEAARSALGELRTQAPELPWGIAMEGRLLEAEGLVPEARALLADNLSLDDADGSIRRTLVGSLLDDDPARAFELVRPWIDAAPSVDATLLTGEAALRAGESLIALELGLRVLRRAPDSSTALGLTLDALGEEGELGLRLLERRLVARPDEVGTRLALVRADMDQGRLEAALTRIDAAPNTDRQLELVAVEALRRIGRSEDAMVRVERLFDAGGASGRAHYERGWLRTGTGALEGAAEDFEQAALDPELAALANYNRGVVLERLERFAESARAYERALETDASLANAWLQLGRHYHVRLGERERALHAYQRFLALAGEDPRVQGWIRELER
ncbi:MAG: tetratricopeptide repeat protein [Planctomycetota bacterium]